jgi:hypothetical protein
MDAAAICDGVAAKSKNSLFRSGADGTVESFVSRAAAD